MELESTKYIAKALIILSMLATAPSEAWVAAKAMDAIGRNPEVGDSIFPKMIVAMAINSHLRTRCILYYLRINKLYGSTRKPGF